jgi:hypothetical protein
VSDAPAVLYLEADDEVTSVVRRIRGADATRVIVAAPGRSRATSSVVALRLVGRAAEASGRDVAIVGDALTRSLATEAGLAAYSSLEDAHSATPAAPSPPVAQAPIRVVRWAEETVSRPAADDITRPVPVQGAMPVVARPRRRSRAATVVAGLVAALLAAAVAGAAILPAATVTIVPVTTEVGPVAYVIETREAERLSGTVEAEATVTATGSYEIVEPATGTVLLRNWSAADQLIEAGTLVAAGEQAFETQADVVVPRGSLTSAGTIAAGQVAVDVVAAAPGPAGNVDAGAIDTILNAGADARLRGFPENPEGRVTNPEPTEGGTDQEGPEITEDDVTAAVRSIRDELESQIAALVAGEAGRIVAEPSLDSPRIDGADVLPGTRDQASVPMVGSQAWEALAVDRAAIEAAALERFAADGAIAPPGQSVLVDTATVRIEGATFEEGTVSVRVTVTGRSAPDVDRAEVAARIAGRSPDQARLALADLGSATVELWPGWVASVPAEWRIDVRVASP